jgi:hypothetical protein
MDQLLALRDAGSEPGSAEARLHVAQCAECAAELERLHQRVARMRALPALRPSRDRFAEVAGRVRGERRQALQRRLGAGALAWPLAGPVHHRARRPHARCGSRVRPVDGHDGGVGGARAGAPGAAPRSARDRCLHGRVAASLEDRIADLDRRLSAAQATAPGVAEAELLSLWRERVGLMDALVDVHVTRAEQVGL